MTGSGAEVLEIGSSDWVVVPRPGDAYAEDEEYFSKVHYWATPQEDCADDDPATTCKTQDDWVNAWSTLRGS